MVKTNSYTVPTKSVLLGGKWLKMRHLKVNNVMKVTTLISDPPPWSDKVSSTFYIQGFGFLFEAEIAAVLTAEYVINVILQNTKYMTMENILVELGLPTALIDGKDYFWDFRSSDDIFVTIDFQHERTIIDCGGDEIECIVISFRQVPECRN